MMKRKKQLAFLCSLILLLTACNTTDDSWYTEGYGYKPITGDAKGIFDFPQDSVEFLRNVFGEDVYTGGIILSGRVTEEYYHYPSGNGTFLVSTDPGMKQFVVPVYGAFVDGNQYFGFLYDSGFLIPGTTYYYCFNAYVDKKVSRPGMLDDKLHYYYYGDYYENGQVRGEIKSFVFSALPELIIQINREYNYTVVDCGVISYKSNPIIEMGICYSTTNTLPTTDDTKWKAEGIQDINNLSFFGANIGDLLEPLNGQNYHLRAYVITKGGTVYSEVFDYPGTR